MDIEQPLVSIILPILKPSANLTRCIESLLKQTYANFEVIAIDDKTKGDGYRTLRKARRADRRFLVSKNKKRYGVVTTLNRALKKAKGQFIVFTNPQDIYNKELIEKEVNFLKTHQKVVAVGTQAIFIDQKSRKLGQTTFPLYHPQIYPQLLHGKSLLFEPTMINTHLLPKDILKFSNQPLQLLYADVFMRFMRYGEFANLYETLTFRVIEPLATSSQRTIGHFFQMLKMWFKSSTEYQYRPSIPNLFSSLIRQA